MKPLERLLPAEASAVDAEYAIGQLAREFNLTLRTLRFYEDKELLHPRRIGTQRIYSRHDRARLKLIVMGKKVGFSLQEISEMLDLYDLEDGQVAQLAQAEERFQTQVLLLKQQRDEIDRAIDELERTVGIVSARLKSKQTAN